MAKLTMMQQLLGQPSQSYRFPKEKNYHSVRPVMLHAATPPGGRDPSVQSSSASSSNSTITISRPMQRSRVSEEPIANSTAYIPDPPSPTSPADEKADVSDSDASFYTPKSSPRESISASDYVLSGPGTSEVIVSPPVVTTVTATRTPAPGRGRYTLSASSMSSTSLDAHSLFSDYSNAISEVTRVTSPMQSEKNTPSPSTSSLARRGSNSDKSKRLARSYTDEEWSKDVRWLVNPAELEKNPKPRRPAASSSRSSSSSVTTTTSTSTTTATSSAGSNRSRSTTKSKSTMKSMAAVMEEAEGVNVIQLNNRTRSRHSASSHSRTGSGSVVSERHRPSPLRQSMSGSDTTERASQKPLKRRRSRSLVDIPSTAYPSSGEIPSSGTQGYTTLTLPRAPPAPLATFDQPKRFGTLEGKVDLTKIGAAQTTMASVEVVRGLGSGHNLNRGMSGLLRRDSSKSRAGGAGPVSGEGVLGFTSYRKPPSFVPGSSLLVQVWSVGLDGVDARLIGAGEPISSLSPSAPATPKLSRTWSLRSEHRRRGSEDSTGNTEQTKPREPDVGFVPGRSFVGRVMECGSEVKEEDVRKGEWVVGLLDIKKCGALQEFIVVERHRIHRIPHPRMQPSISPPPPSRSSISGSLLSSTTAATTVVPSSSTALSLSELALLPLSGVQAYRAVKSIINALPDGKRVLVLRGHDGVGAMAVQMLAKHGWKVCAHAILPTTFRQDAEAEEEAYMMAVESRVASWGAEEVIFDSETVGVLERLLEDGDVFDAILDTVGGKEVWEASERLLRNVGPADEEPIAVPQKRGFLRRRKTTGKGSSMEVIGKQFTTVVGDTPERAIPTAKDHFKAGMRSMKSGPDVHPSPPPSSASTPNITLRKKNVHVGYSWISVGQDVDVDGEDIRDSLGCVLKMEGVRPHAVEENVLAFESAPKAFRREPLGNSGMLMGNGTAVVRIAS